MLKVFLVEDEFVVREGIKNNVDWAAHGYEFCGEASDGELAFPMIQKLKPDIVITDIKMPFMDGLELSRLIKKEYPWIEIIILSGYAEFDYAKEAISIGVAHYLTKPISGAALLEEINKLAESIEAKKEDRELRQKYLSDMLENTAEDRKKLFGYMVTGDKSMSDLLELAGRLELDISALCYNIVLLKIKSDRHEADEYSKSEVEVEERVADYIDSSSTIMFDRNTEGKALLFKADSAEELEKVQNMAIEGIVKLLEEYPHIHYFGGIGKPVNRLGELSVSFEAAAHAFAHRYMEDTSRFMDYRDVSDGHNSVAQDDFAIKSVDPREVDQRKIVEFLKQGGIEEVGYYVDEYFNKLGENSMKSNMFRQYIVMGMYFNVVYFVEELGFSKDEIKEFSIADGDIQSVEGTRKYLVEILSKALELRDNTARKKYNDVVDMVIEYIEAHYGDEELSLNFLASYVNFSPNHLSMLFSQQTGMSFIKYLTDFRMNKAKELLKCTNKRSVDISTEVGYKDPHYFSYCFKKNTGMTPTQYRSGDKEETNE